MNKRSYPDYPVLLVDDEPHALNSMKVILNSDGITNVQCIQNPRDVLSFMTTNQVSMVLLDLNMPGISGLQLLETLHQEFPDTPIIMVTGETDINQAVHCMKQGAFDYILKPLDKNQLVSAVRHGINFRELQQEYVDLKERFFRNKIDNPQAFESIVTNNDQMKILFQYIESIATTKKPVLITGETGVGKDLIAKAIHRLSGLSGKMVAENVSGQDDNLFSDTFFGHSKGAFTGALNDRKGLIEQAAEGTLFLDEIGDLSLESQVKLLRLLQENVYRPIGSDSLKRANVRIIAATNQDLKELQKEKQFRADLYYRFNIHRIHVPPLRERMGDLPLLVNHFLERASEELGRSKPSPPPELFAMLRSYSFPGNIRELEALIYNALSSSHGSKLSMGPIKEVLNGRNREEPGEMKESKPFSYGRFPTLKEAEKFLISEALHLANNNKSIASAMLGISRQALSKRLIRAEKKSQGNA